MSMSIYRKIYIFLLVVSFLVTISSIYAIWSQPHFQVLVDRSSEMIAASIEKQIGRYVTPEMVTERLSDRLSEENRNWVVIEAIREIAGERGIKISAELQSEYVKVFEEGHDTRGHIENCADCLWDAKNCDLSPSLVCQGIAVLTPFGDITGIVRESSNHVTGKPVDEFELVLSAVGLGAFVIVPLTGGTSWTIKTGASLAKVARRMGLLSQKLIKIAKKSIKKSVETMTESQATGPVSRLSLPKLPRAVSIRPVTDILDSFGRMKESAGLLAALHLTRYIDTPLDARKVARISEVEKTRTVGVMELLGKNRTLKAAMRYSDEIWWVFSGVIGMITSILALMFNAIVSLAMGSLRRAVYKRGH